MRLSPDDIANRAFTVTHRGYDRSEVHAFLVQVARQIRVSVKGDGAIDVQSAEKAEAVIAAAEREAEAIVAEAMKTRAEADTYAASIRLHADGVSPTAARTATASTAAEPEPLVSAAPSGAPSEPVRASASSADDTSALSEHRFAELLDAERDIVRRLESTSQDLQQTYGAGADTTSLEPAASDSAAASSASATRAGVAPPTRPAAASPTPSPPKAKPLSAPKPAPTAPAVDLTDPSSADSSSASSTPATPTSTSMPESPPVQATPSYTSSIDVDDDLEVVKKASDLLDGVLDDVMGSLRNNDA